MVPSVCKPNQKTADSCHCKNLKIANSPQLLKASQDFPMFSVSQKTDDDVVFL